jgi:hypothetical protein
MFMLMVKFTYRSRTRLSRFEARWPISTPKVI